MPYPYVAARNQGGSRSRTQFIVVHTMEAPKTNTAAESTAHYFATTSPVGSSHYCVDTNSVVQCVPDDKIANHAGGANSISIGIEHAGYAAQSVTDWYDAYNTAMLRDQSAPLMAGLLNKYGLPNVFLTAADLLAGKKGWTTHNEVSHAYHKSTHWDPGPNFPIGQYAQFIGAAGAGVPPGGNPTPTPTPKPPPSGAHPTVKRGSKGSAVKDLQNKLNVVSGSGLVADGSFGQATDIAVRSFQKFFGLGVDGIFGPASWSLLDYLYTLKTNPAPAPAPTPPPAPPAPAPVTSKKDDAMYVLTIKADDGTLSYRSLSSTSMRTITVDQFALCAFGGIPQLGDGHQYTVMQALSIGLAFGVQFVK